MPRAYIGLGANLGEREQTLARALQLLESDAAIAVVAVSTLRETEPWGPVADQPRFLNGVAVVDTDLAPRDLLERLLALERSLGRTRDGPRWGPRTIDLDLLVYGEEVIDEHGLRVPHPRLAERRFVLEPLAEVAPDLVVPGAGQVENLLASLQCTP